MSRWLAVNEDNMIRAICTTKENAMWEAECERINDIQQGFTPDEYRFIKAEYVATDDKGDIYNADNWMEV